MKNFLTLSLLALALSACGSDDKKTTSDGLTGTEGPNVTVPAGAHLSDYDCLTREEFSENGVAKVTETRTTGMTSFWKEDGFSFSYDEDTDGNYKGLNKYRKTPTELTKYRQEGELRQWLMEGGKWLKFEKSYVRVFEKNGSIIRNLSNIEDGAEKPYYYVREVTEIDRDTTRTVSRHTNPGVRNRDGRTFTSIVETCTDKERL